MRTRRFSLTLFLGIFLLSLAVPLAQVRADGLLFIEGVYRQPQTSAIRVMIKDHIATTTLEQTFRNTLEKQVSAVYVAPVPEGATITSFAQLLDGQWVEATIKTKEEADKEFKEASAKGEDASTVSGVVATPAGLDPKTTFQTRLVLPAQSERSVRLTYTEVLVGQVGLTRYTYALSNTNLTDEPIGDLLVNVKIIENDEIRAVYSPSHKEAEVARPEKNTAEVVYRAQNVTPSQNFELVYTKSTEKFGLNLASYRESSSDDGYFVLIAAPQLEAKKDDVIQKDFVFILDRSGSMSGPKFEQARAALRNILDALNPEDRFTVVTFDDKVQSYSDRLESLERREDAKKWIAGLRPGGGTNINEALLTGLKTVDQSPNRPHIVVFLTDGQATNGVTATTAILSNVREKIRPQSRIYTIGIGDVNQALLESLAQENRGTSLFVTATENVEKPLANFYAAIDSPVLVDLSLDFGGVEVYDLQPKKIPDMFLGGQVVLTGRYKPGKDLATVTLTGTINGQKHVSTYQNIKFITDAAEAKLYGFVPRLWAQRKVDSLVRDLQINGPNPTLIEEVKDLGLKYKIVTPYTSFIVTNKDPKLIQPPPAGLPKTGLPFLYVDEYRTVNTALMAAGAALALVGLVGLTLSRRARKA